MSHLRVVQRRHWCWNATLSGRLLPKEQMLDLIDKSVNHRQAAENIVADMIQFARNPQAPGVRIRQEGDGLRALGSKSGGANLRLYFFENAEHLVIVRVVPKDQNKLDKTLKEQAVKVMRAWTPTDCTGEVDFSDIET